MPIVRALDRAGFAVAVIFNRYAEDISVHFPPGVEAIHVPIERRPDIIRDFRCLIRLFRIFVKGRFDVVHTITPKAGLLGMCAARFAGVPVRVHTFQGEVWATCTGVWRFILKNLDRLTVYFASHLLVVSRSELAFLAEQHVINPRHADVLGAGSICGVDTERFRPNEDARRRIRRELDSGAEDVVFLFLGRINRDKGVSDLVEAYRTVHRHYKSTTLWLVGPDEGGLVPEILRAAAGTDVRIRVTDHTNNPEDYVAAADVLCLPSYREGFGLVLIEAGAAALPAIGARIYGITDAVEEGETGLLHDPGDIAGLAKAMESLAADPDLRGRLGRQGRTRAEKLFRQEDIVAMYIEYYRRMF